METMLDTISKGGNILINVGPTLEGVIPLIMQERLLQMGDWLSVNGEAVRCLSLQISLQIKSTYLFQGCYS